MAQWMNLQRIEKFAYCTRLYITCEKTGGLNLAEPGFTAGWSSSCPSIELDTRGQLAVTPRECHLLAG